MDAVLQRKLWIRKPTGPDCSYVVLAQLRPDNLLAARPGLRPQSRGMFVATKHPAVAIFVHGVFCGGCPPKITDVVIEWIAIPMSALQTRLRFSSERLKNQPVRQMIRILAVGAEVILNVPSRVQSRPDQLPSRFTPIDSSPYVTEFADFVSFASVDDFPPTFQRRWIERCHLSARLPSVCAPKVPQQQGMDRYRAYPTKPAHFRRRAATCGIRDKEDRPTDRLISGRAPWAARRSGDGPGRHHCCRNRDSAAS